MVPQTAPVAIPDAAHPGPAADNLSSLTAGGTMRGEEHKKLVAMIRVGESQTRLNRQQAAVLRGRERVVVAAAGLVGLAAPALAGYALVMDRLPYVHFRAMAATVLVCGLAPVVVAFRAAWGGPERSSLARQQRRAARLTALTELVRSLGEKADAGEQVALGAITDALHDEIAELREDEDGVPLATRRHKRLVPRETRTVVRTPDGRRQVARIVDVSLSGVAIETELRGVTVGTEVVLGGRPARAVRKLSRGMAFEFATALDPASFSEEIVL